MTHADHYFAPGWFFLVQRPSGKRVGLAISGHDTDMDEGFIDWVQLLPRFRRRGLGTLLVRESIHRLRQARLITVSGTLDAPFAAGDLYRKCGFEQERQWTILGQERRQARDGTAALPPANGSDKQ
jgi:ribosomal protein S18 acetylase RimI-like enzyme